MQYELNNGVATLSFDDGKANVVGPDFLENINARLDRAEKEQAVDAGFTDEVVAADDLAARSMEVAQQLAQLPQAQFAANKLSIRAGTLQVMKDSLEQLTKRS